MGAGQEARARVFEAPGVERSFERAIDGTTIEALAPTLPLLGDSLALLGGTMVEPLKCTLELVSVTADGRFQRARTPELRDWVIQAPLPSHGRRAPSEWPLITEAPALTPPVLEAWIRRALAEPSPAGTSTWFDGLQSSETRVRVPDAMAADAIELVGTGIRVPVERRADGSRWVAGTSGSTNVPPVRLRVRVADESITLSLGFCWSVWTEPGSPGRALVDRVATDLIAIGWQDLGWEDDENAPGSGESVLGGRIAVGPRLRSGANDQVAVGWRADDPATRFLVTLTDGHAEPRGELARRLALPFDGVAALEAIGSPDPPLTFTDALVERLPGGRPASELAPLGERALAVIGAQVARILVPIHAAGQMLLGIHPALIYVEPASDGLLHVTGLLPRGPLFVASARAPSRGPSSYQLPYIGPELVTETAPQARTDVFALCASLHHLGTGTHPFGTLAELPQLISRIAGGAPDPWPGGGPFGELLARGMAPRVADRPSAAELADAFEALVG